MSSLTTNYNWKGMIVLSLKFYKKEIKKVMDVIDVAKLESIARLIVSTAEQDGMIYVCGNGGSGATANLFADSLQDVPIASSNHRRLRAVSLNWNMAKITSISNARGYAHCFSQQIRSLGRKQDLLIVISGSGNSPNIIEAVCEAQRHEMIVAGLTGMNGGKLVMLVEDLIVVDSMDMEQIENAHSIIMNAILKYVEGELTIQREWNLATRAQR